MDSTAIFLKLHDPIYMVVQGTNISNTSGSSGGLDWKILIPIVIGFSTGLLGALVAYWSKRQDLKTFQENLSLQKKLFDLTKSKTESDLKAEIEKLENLAKQYQLSLDKFDYEKLEKILEFGSDKEEKKSMIKEFNAILKKYKVDVPLWIEDSYEYEQEVAMQLYPNLSHISKDIDDLLINHATVFSSIHDQFRLVASKIRWLEQDIFRFTEHSNDDQDYELIVIDKFRPQFFELYQHLYNLLSLMKSEFEELDKMKRDFINGQFQNRTI